MTLSEHACRTRSFDFVILGTDVSTRVLASARKAIYSTSQVEAVPPELRKKYLLRSRNPSEKFARITPSLRRKVGFHQLNFMHDSYPVRDMFDVVFCRNVLIYFDKSTQEAVINKLCRNLIPGGYLFAGHSESLAGMAIPLVALKTAIYRKHGDGRC
jgi:chemotaxis protein methyltransferase CheR